MSGNYNRLLSHRIKFDISNLNLKLECAMTSTLRSIDLTTKLAAPIVTGQVIYFLHLGYGAVFVAGWNAVSLVVEYLMIKKVYDQIPSLAKEKLREEVDDARETVDETAPLIGSGSSTVAYNSDQTVTIEHSNDDSKQRDFTESGIQEDGDIPAHKTSNHYGATPGETSPDFESGVKPKEEMKEGKTQCCYTIFYSFIVLYKGWKTFMGYKVAFAGLGLATLYMTVLGFDNITVGYAYSQGISESLLGIFMAVGSLFGISGTFAYPVLRRHLGLKTTGLSGMLFQISCLSACVVSVFLAGSPFDLLHRLNGDDANNTIVNATDILTTQLPSNVSLITEQYNVTSPTDSETDDDPDTYLSIGVFLGGLIVARFGLWIADLSITQLFLQTVKEKERGLVSGVQNSLNQLMDMLKALMVILAPYPEEFGLLTIISFAFVCSGCLLYVKFIVSNRGISYG